jgi:hypothetical protein
MPSPAFPVQRIISGGQTGADRAALDFAIAHSLPYGGWLPAGRRTEDGLLPERYQLRETPSASYEQRTEWNVRDADATLLITFGPLTGGSAFTLEAARRHGKPVLYVDRAQTGTEEAARNVRDWLARVRPATLNIAGPRASEAPEIYGIVRDLLERVLAGG